jgi:hypothetical protein
VGLLHDTGHVTFAGGDAPTELAKHIERVCHVHCKDVRPASPRMARNRGWSFLDSVLNGAFSTPGEGCVDFAAVDAILRKAGYADGSWSRVSKTPPSRPRTATPRWRIGCCRRSSPEIPTPRLAPRRESRSARRPDAMAGERGGYCRMSSNLLVKAARTGRTIARVTPQSAGWRYVGFEALWLAPGERYTGKTGDRELCIVVVSVESSSKAAISYSPSSARARALSRTCRPDAVYLPPGRRRHLSPA